MGYEFSASEDTAQTHLVSLVNYLDKLPSFDAFTRNAINMFCSIGTLHTSKKRHAIVSSCCCLLIMIG